MVRHHRHRATTAMAALLSLLVCWGCAPKAIGPPGPDGKPQTWRQMGIENRKALMRREVLPRAAALFSE